MEGFGEKMVRSGYGWMRGSVAGMKKVLSAKEKAKQEGKIERLG